MYNMVRSMVSRSVPIDGVGLQAHLALDHDQLLADSTTAAELQAVEKLERVPTESAVSANIARYGRLGLQVRDARRCAQSMERRSPPWWDPSSPLWDVLAPWDATLRQVHITELDVKCPDPCTPERLEAQADAYDVMLRACLAHPGVCTSFETWGFTDKYTWLVGSRCPGAAECHPLPFDEQYRAKPAAQRVLARLQSGL